MTSKNHCTAYWTTTRLLLQHWMNMAQLCTTVP